jgi:hypothetical protein
MTLSHPGPAGYSPLGTPNVGRAERLKRYDEREALRWRMAAARLDQRPGSDDGEMRSLRAELRALRDGLTEFQAELPALIEAEVARVLADQLPEAMDYLLSRRGVSRNGDQTEYDHRRA